MTQAGENQSVCRGWLGRRGYSIFYHKTRHAVVPPSRPSTTWKTSAGRRCAGWASFWLLLLLLSSSSAGAFAAGRPRVHGPRDAEAIRQPPIQERTARRREVLVEGFCRVVEDQTGATFEDLTVTDLPQVSDLLKKCGWRAFESGWAIHDFRNLLLGLGDRYPWARPSFGSGWRVVQRWQMLEPGTPHAPLPLPLFRATLAIAGAWRWWRVLLSTFLGFYALLRPGEVCGLTRAAILLPRGNGDEQDLLIRVLSPKRRAGGARVEYTKVDREFVPELVMRLLSQLGPTERIWPGSPELLVRRLRKIWALFVPSPRTFSLGSFRAGGATFLFGHWSEDLQRLSWRGRWRALPTLAHYVQELGAARIALQWTEIQRCRIDKASEAWSLVVLELLEVFLCEGW